MAAPPPPSPLESRCLTPTLRPLDSSQWLDELDEDDLWWTRAVCPWVPQRISWTRLWARVGSVELLWFLRGGTCSLALSLTLLLSSTYTLSEQPLPAVFWGDGVHGPS